MARPTFFRCHKLRRLVHILGIPRPHVVGYCETLWHAAYEAGDAVVGDAVDVELAAEWEGDPGVLVEALVSCGRAGGPGLLIETEEGYVIHDFEDNAPGYVKERWRKRQERAAKSEPKRDKPKKVPDASRTVPDASGKVCLSSPLPSSPSSIEDSNAGERSRVTLDERFEALWDSFPKKIGKKDARKAWDVARKEKGYPGDERLLNAIRASARAWRLEKREKKYIPNPATWIRQGRWDDEIATVEREGFVLGSDGVWEQIQ